jgi:hypothetical protein
LRDEIRRAHASIYRAFGTEVLGTEASTSSTSTQCAATVSPEHAARPHPNAPTSQNATAQGSCNAGACFKCGLTGHFAWQCPSRPAVPGAGNQAKPQGRQNFMYGRLNHMTSEEAQQAQDMVLGMFLTSSYPATILFDSGASHSFISSSFVVKHNLPIATMKHTMFVSSPRGEMRTRHICPVVSVTIRGGGILSIKPHPFRLQGYRHHTWHGLVKQV